MTILQCFSESDVFNYLEIMSNRVDVRTPILNCRMGCALGYQSTSCPAEFHTEFRRSRVNWIIQSSAVDFLHLLLTCMDWLCRVYHIPARFVISIHDEVRVLFEDNALSLDLSRFDLWSKIVTMKSIDVHSRCKSAIYSYVQ